MRAGSAAIDLAEKYDLLNHVEKVSVESLRYLRDLGRESKYIGEVRGRGLMISIEFVKDEEDKEPFADSVS
jgi:diaminobutyrate-2-oxoglutarate transaminase